MTVLEGFTSNIANLSRLFGRYLPDSEIWCCIPVSTSDYAFLMHNRLLIFDNSPLTEAFGLVTQPCLRYRSGECIIE